MTLTVYQSRLKDELLQYEEFCRLSYKEHTCDMYRIHMRSFDRYLHEIDFDADYISEEVITGFIKSELREACENTLNGYLTALRGFIRFRIGLGQKSYLPPLRKKADDYNPYIFSDEEIRRIFEIADNYDVHSHNRLPYISLEFPMVLRLLYGCGLRLEETLEIKMGEVDIDHNTLILKRTKWSKERYVPMHQSLGDILRSYCSVIGILGKPDVYIFPRIDFSEHLKQFDMRNRFNRLLRIANISLPNRKHQERGPCMHGFRHHFVFSSFRQLEEMGVRVDDAIPYLSIYLGHYDLTETEKYMKFSSELFGAEMDRFDSFSDDIFPDVFDLGEVLL